MRAILSTIGFAAAVAAHGYVDNATIGGQNYVFYQPYQDPYMNPAVSSLHPFLPLQKLNIVYRLLASPASFKATVLSLT
jgi:hypothetical protein